MDLQGEPGWLEKLWEAAAFYEFFAHAYGWTPDQVDDQRALYVELYPEIRAMRDEIKSEREKAVGRGS